MALVDRSSRSDEMRLRYLYRAHILRGRARLPLKVARRLVGPDCAYHLYGTLGTDAATEAAPDEDGVGDDEEPAR